MLIYVFRGRARFVCALVSLCILLELRTQFFHSLKVVFLCVCKFMCFCVVAWMRLVRLAVMFLFFFSVVAMCVYLCGFFSSYFQFTTVGASVEFALTSFMVFFFSCETHYLTHATAEGRDIEYGKAKYQFGRQSLSNRWLLSIVKANTTASTVLFAFLFWRSKTSS